MKGARMTGFSGSVERQPVYSSRGVVGVMRGSGSAEARVQGSLASIMRLMGYLTALPGAEHEWCDVTLTIEGDEGLVTEFSRRCYEFVHGKPAIPDGSGPKDG